MPPLCVVGYGIAVMTTLDPLQGASNRPRRRTALFATNVAGIALTSMIVFRLARIERPLAVGNRDRSVAYPYD